MTQESSVVVGRLRKRLVKLTKQRDHWKSEHDTLRAALARLPVWENAIRKLDEVQKTAADRRALEERVKEQALLIKKLTKGE